MSDINEALKTALAEGAKAAPVHDLPGGGIGIVVPDGYTLEKVAPLEPALTRIHQGVLLHTLDSFLAYVERYKGADTQIFAEPGFLAQGQRPIVTAVIDYHGVDRPDYAAHIASYQPRYSDQWQRWHKACAAPLKQAEFAEFIEEVRADIREPTAAQLLDIVRTFKASKRVEFDSVVYQPNGDVRLAYDERTEQKGSSGALPEQMRLGIPVYFRGAHYEVPVLVRYRVGDGAVKFSLKIDRGDVIEDAAFNAIAIDIEARTGIAPYIGRRQ